MRLNFDNFVSMGKIGTLMILLSTLFHSIDKEKLREATEIKSDYKCFEALGLEIKHA